jgi:two-component system, LytTR family, response regulator
MTETSLRALIVDDELHSRRYLSELLEGETNVSVVGEASSGAEGVEQIETQEPDIVFLDIQMSDLDGFELVKRIEGPRLPLFIFVTGYTEYAVRAFEIEAVDYLCKPFDKERLAIALERARRRMNRSEDAVGNVGDHYLSWLWIREGSGYIFVPVEQIVWIEAANKYVVVHTASGGAHIARLTIQGLQDKLDPEQFVRVHRSTIVRKAAVRGIQPFFHGDYIVKLANGAEVTLSRNFRVSFFDGMGG